MQYATQACGAGVLWRHLPRRPSTSTRTCASVCWLLRVSAAQLPRSSTSARLARATTTRGGRCVAMSSDRPKVVGLTGSIGMGKSTVSNVFRKNEIPVMDADQVVHDMYAQGGAAVEPVGAAFPGVVVDGAISRPELGKYVINQDDNMKRLEAIVHPLVHAERERFLAQATAEQRALVVLDIPLLYETKAERTVDAVVVVSTRDAAEQRRRVCARPGMTEEKFDAILARQVPDEDKCRRADHVVDTGCSLEETEAAVVSLIQQLTRD